MAVISWSRSRESGLPAIFFQESSLWNLNVEEICMLADEFRRAVCLLLSGELQRSIVSTETWDGEKEHYIQQQALKDSSCLQEPPNVIIYNFANATVSFFCTLTSLVQYSQLINCHNHYIHGVLDWAVRAPLQHSSSDILGLSWLLPQLEFFHQPESLLNL